MLRNACAPQGIGAIVLTFLAGAELDPQVFKLKWREAAAVGLASFALPFLGCAAAAHYVLGWELMPSWLAGVAMSTTSVAVVYAVMLEFGFNVTDYGKTVLAACFVTDLGTVVALGLIFAPFTMKTMTFVGAGVVVLIVLPWLTPRTVAIAAQERTTTIGRRSNAVPIPQSPRISLRATSSR
jgi:glutathione-regulated potassium-efflux system ancillary protein KefC